MLSKAYKMERIYSIYLAYWTNRFVTYVAYVPFVQTHGQMVHLLHMLQIDLLDLVVLPPDCNIKRILVYRNLNESALRDLGDADVHRALNVWPRLVGREGAGGCIVGYSFV